MAYLTSEEYKSNIYNENSEQTLDLIINGTKINDDYVKNVKFKDNIFENDTFSLGSAIASEFDIELSNDFKEEIDTSDFKEIEIQSNLILSNGKETVPLGNYIVKKRDDSSSDYTKLTLYDYIDKLNVEFDGSSIVPCTRFELLKAICDFCNLELENDSILNGDILVNTYDNTLLAKTYVSFIAERAGSYAKVIRNKLKIIPFSDVDEIELPDISGDYTTNELKTITKIVYENGIQSFSQGDDSGEIIYLSNESPFSCTQEEVDNIYNKLNGLQYQSLTIKVWGDPAIDTGDKIKLNDIVSFCQKDWTWGNGFYGNYKTVLNKTNKLSAVSKVSNETKIRRLHSLINELDGYIEILAQETEGQNEKLTKYYQDFNNFILSVKNTGKNNIIKNSVMFAYDENNNPTDWEISDDGILNIDSSSESITAGGISGHVFTLLDKKVTQKVFVKQDDSSIPEKDKTYYTFSTKIKKYTTGTCYIKIYNSVETYTIELNPGDNCFYKEFEINSLLPKENYYIIEFYGSSDSGATFTDNMLNIGSYKSQWSQADGEVMNTQVNINVDGVLVKSSVYEGDYTIMSPIEFAGYSKINGVVTKVFTINKDTTLVKKLEIEDGIAMPPIKIVPVTEGDMIGWAFVPTTEG